MLLIVTELEMYGELYADSLAHHVVKITPDMVSAGVDLAVDFASGSVVVDSPGLSEDAFEALRAAIEKVFPGALAQPGQQSVAITFGAPTEPDVVPVLHGADGPSRRFISRALKTWKPSIAIVIDGLDETGSGDVYGGAIVDQVRQLGLHATRFRHVSPLWIVALLTAVRSAVQHVQHLHVGKLRLVAVRMLARNVRACVPTRRVAGSPSKPRGPNSAICRHTGRGMPVLR